MFSYSQIARWLSFPVDPITVEDWVANREIFGVDKDDNSEHADELETAYQVEKLRELGAASAKSSGEPKKDLSLFMQLNGVEASGLIDQQEYLLVAPLGWGNAGRVAEVKLAYIGSKPEKIDVGGGDVLVHQLDPTRSLKIQVRLGGDLKIDGKSQAAWSGAGKKLLVFDSRGRPLPEFEPGEKQQEMIKKMKEGLS